MKHSRDISRRTVLLGMAAAGTSACTNGSLSGRTKAALAGPAPIIAPTIAENVLGSRVEFPSHGANLVGDLYVPRNAQGPLAVAVFLGPFGYVREQAPSYYAPRLAAANIAALAFDCRGHGESGGEPRRYESPKMKVADAKAAIDFLTSRPEIDPQKIFAIGICQGSSPIVQLASEDARVAGAITIAAAFLTGGTWRVDRGLEARHKFEKTGEVDYLPIIDARRSDVGLPSPYIWRWYRRWIGTSRWENRYAVMSDAEVWAFDMSRAAKNLMCPYLLVHSQDAHDPADARNVFETIGSHDKRQVFLEGAPDQVKFYDDTPTVNRAAENVTQWIKERL